MDGSVDTSCAQFELRRGFARTPSNIMLFFGVTDCNGNPLSGLSAADFEITENGEAVSPLESGQTILQRTLGYQLYSHVLLDTSDSVTQSGSLPALIEAVHQFINATVAVDQNTQIAISLFDGQMNVVPLIDYSRDASALNDIVDTLTNYRAADPSTNLNGAIVQGLSSLDTVVSGSEAGLSLGSLLVFTDGQDQTNYVSTQTALSAINSSAHSVFTIGFGNDIDESSLRSLGKTGFIQSQTGQELASAFTEVATQLKSRAESNYILGYCSPKRAGTNELALSIKDKRGSLKYGFDATGFTTGCNANLIANPCQSRQCGSVDGIVCGTCAEGETCLETGICMGAEPVDAGVSDAGTGPGRPGNEGYPCEIDPISGVEVCDDGLECFLMSSTSETNNPISICIRRCESDGECTGSTIGNTLCREIRFGRDACVSGEVDEGEIAELSMRRGGPMTGCSNNRSAGDAYLVGIARWSGSGLWQLEADQSSCVRKCSIDDASDCTSAFPYCNAPFFTDGGGACSTAYKKSGARCSRLNGTEMCSNDDDYDGELVCWDYLGSHDDPNIGQCVQLCSIAMQDCKTTHDPSLTPRCLDLDVSTSNPDRGMCSDECSRYPEDCAGTGQPGLGQNCAYGFLQSSTVSTIDNPDISFCWDIEPPVLGLWENGSTFDNCYNERFSCPSGAHCETHGFQGPRGACFHGCTTASGATATGCENVVIGSTSIATTCEKARDPQFDAGRCMPIQ